MYRKETWEDTGGGSTQEGPEERDKEKGGETERRVEVFKRIKGVVEKCYCKSSARGRL